MMLNFQACPDVEGTESTGELNIDTERWKNLIDFGKF